MFQGRVSGHSKWASFYKGAALEWACASLVPSHARYAYRSSVELPSNGQLVEALPLATSGISQKRDFKADVVEFWNAVLKPESAGCWTFTRGR